MLTPAKIFNLENFRLYGSYALSQKLKFVDNGVILQSTGVEAGKQKVATM